METYRFYRAMASAVEAAGASWRVEVKLPPLAISAQVGAVREGLQGGGVFSYCDLALRSTSLLPQREGRAGCRPPGQYKRALTPRPLSGGRGGVWPGAPRGPSTLAPSWGGGEERRGRRARRHRLLMTNVGWGLDECWLGTDTNVGWGLNHYNFV
jgi:hypothetical protein